MKSEEKHLNIHLIWLGCMFVYGEMNEVIVISFSLWKNVVWLFTDGWLQGHSEQRNDEMTPRENWKTCLICLLLDIIQFDT